MKKWINILIGVLFIAGVITILFISKKEQKNQTMYTPNIYIDIQGENAFLTKKELYTRLQREGFIFKNQKFTQLNIRKIENYIQRMSEVLETKTYVNIGNKWNIYVKLRKPIARIFNKYGENFYLDELGHLIKPSYLYTARVVVVTGEIPDRNNGINVQTIVNNYHLINSFTLDDIYRISRYVCNDSFFSNQIGQIHREKNGSFVLIPRIGRQKIIFGTAYSNAEVKSKFRKLADFYREGIPYEGWNTYDIIDLSYDNQVVCSKIEQ